MHLDFGDVGSQGTRPTSPSPRIFTRKTHPRSPHRREDHCSHSQSQQQPQKKPQNRQIAMPMKARRSDIQQIEPIAIASNHLAGACPIPTSYQRDPAIDPQTADADRDRRTIDHKTPARILVAQPGEEIADEQCDKGWLAARSGAAKGVSARAKMASESFNFNKLSPLGFESTRILTSTPGLTSTKVVASPIARSRYLCL